MKKITRRLYTKPVMLGLAFLVGMALVVGLFVTANSRAAATPYFQAGDDKFETTNNGETYHNFSASKIPANFFGPGSQEYSGLVPLVGVPLPGEGDVDTVIHRNQDVDVPGSTTITMSALSLKSINPITVTYTGGATESWNVQVGLSDFKASTGTMSIESGGTFDSSLKVWPKFTFTRIPDGATKVLDTGGSGLTANAAQSTSASNEVEPGPEPVATIAPCPVVIGDFESRFNSGTTLAAASSSSCAPVTLTSNNSPWVICTGGGFCIPRPITEAELLAAHNASPPGTKKKVIAVKPIAIQ